MGDQTQYELELVKGWLDAMQERGIFNSNTARLRTTAIEQFSTILADDEPKTVSYMLDNIDSITDRWTRKKNANPETAAAYRSRGKIALEEFLAYQVNPTGFKSKARPMGGEKKAPEKEKTSTKAAASPPPVTEVTPPISALLRCPISDGESFQYKMPDKGLSVADVQRIALHLLTMAQDFDPSRHTNFFALARIEN